MSKEEGHDMRGIPFVSPLASVFYAKKKSQGQEVCTQKKVSVNKNDQRKR